jgi:hypothetical protein
MLLLLHIFADRVYHLSFSITAASVCPPRFGRPTSPDIHSRVRPPLSVHKYYIVLRSIDSHSSDLLFIHVLLEAVVQVLPPLE